MCMTNLAPLVSEAKAKNIKNTFTQNTKISYVVYVVLTAVIAPLAAITLLIPSWNERFVTGMAKEVLKPQ